MTKTVHSLREQMHSTGNFFLLRITLHTNVLLHWLWSLTNKQQKGGTFFEKLNCRQNCEKRCKRTFYKIVTIISSSDHFSSLSSESISGIPLVVKVTWPSTLIQVRIVVGSSSAALASKSKSNGCWWRSNRSASAWVKKSPLGLTLASLQCSFFRVDHLVQRVQLLW